MQLGEEISQCLVLVFVVFFGLQLEVVQGIEEQVGVVLFVQFCGVFEQVCLLIWCGEVYYLVVLGLVVDCVFVLGQVVIGDGGGVVVEFVD